jgi:hypothetical protein
MAKSNTYFKLANLYNNLPNIINYINNNNKCWLLCVGYQETLLLIHFLSNDIKVKSSLPYYSILKKYD